MLAIRYYVECWDVKFDADKVIMTEFGFVSKNANLTIEEFINKYNKTCRLKSYNYLNNGVTYIDRKNINETQTYMLVNIEKSQQIFLDLTMLELIASYYDEILYFGG